MSRTKNCLLLGTLLIALVGSVGCDNNITGDSVRGNMSPEMASIAMTGEQQKNMESRSIDTNIRQVYDDWDELWLLDRPRNFSRYPVPIR